MIQGRGRSGFNSLSANELIEWTPACLPSHQQMKTYSTTFQPRSASRNDQTGEHFGSHLCGVICFRCHWSLAVITFQVNHI